MNNELLKSQTVRLIDIFIIAPLMIYSGTQVEEEWLRSSLFITGFMTIMYNGNNYAKFKQPTQSNDIP